MIARIFLAVMAAIFGQPRLARAMAEWCELDPVVFVRKLRGQHFTFHLTWRGEASPEALAALATPEGKIRRGSTDFVLDVPPPDFPWAFTVEAYQEDQTVPYCTQTYGSAQSPLLPGRTPVRVTIDLP